jgi:aldose 1-epimerase
LGQNDVGVSTGEIIDIGSSVMDFTKVSSLAQVKARGMDDHLLFDDAKSHLRAVAYIQNAQGLGIRIHSDQLGAQIYTANGMGPIEGGLDGAVYGSAAGICFEPQGHPNAVNIPGFPSVMVTPDAPYKQTLLVKTLGFES